MKTIHPVVAEMFVYRNGDYQLVTVATFITSRPITARNQETKTDVALTLREQRTAAQLLGQQWARMVRL